MATKNPRLNVVLEPSLFLVVRQLAKRDGTSLSLKARDLIREAIEFCEDVHWAKAAGRREKTFSQRSALGHEEIWTKSK